MQITPEPERQSQTDLGTMIQEYVALKNQVKEARSAIKVMTGAQSNVLDKIASEMKRLGKRRLEVQSTGDVIMQQTRKVTKKPKITDLPGIYRDVLGDEQAEKLEKHIEKLTHQEVVTCITHRKLHVDVDVDEDHLEDGSEESDK